MASFFTKGMNFARAYAKWRARGSLLRSPEYIAELYTICKSCPTNQFIELGKDRGECNQCGCHILNVSPEVTKINKLAWPTEGCPDGHWNADVDEED